MKEILKKLPNRSKKPRNNGLTMIMDKGLGLKQAEYLIEVNHEYTDIVKLGFGTSIITPKVIDKIKMYQENNMMVYVGGTLFEAFIIRNQLDDFKKLLNNLKLEMVEISDGCINMEHDKKCNIISDFARDFKVISEVGSKDANVKINKKDWVKWIKDEISAGSWKVILEAREAGNVGIFSSNGNVKNELIDSITQAINVNKILWEAPKKDQQEWFIKKYGAEVNLGNISPDEVIALETLRLGLRGDTFYNFI